MPVQEQETKVHLFVGFGGSGGRTLAHFANLASQDRAWVTRADRSVYFLLCDTDKDELAKAEEDILCSFEPCGYAPVLKRVSLADGVQSMERHIARVFDNSSAEGRERLAEHWWVNDAGTPFKAAHLATPPTQGASQCPAVSTFLAWSHAESLSRVVDEIVHEMKSRIGAGGGSIPVDVTFISSLAGGTGRGCWPILGFLIRQALKRHDLDCHPQGYFFDQSCFSTVAARHPQQAAKLMVNSLTGLSELIMWVRNDEPKAADKILHSLPRMGNTADRQQDVLKVKLGSGPDAKGKSPLNHAWVIFDQSISGQQTRPDDFYNMVAGCLYCQVATDMSSQEANNLQSFGSAGSAVYRVPINEIRSYLVDKVVTIMCDRLACGTSDRVESLVQRLHDKWGTTADDLETFGEQPDELGGLLQRVAHHIGQKIQCGALLTSLKDQDVDDAKCHARDLETANDELVASACLAALGFKERDKKLPAKETVKAAVVQRATADIQSAVGSGGISLGKLKELCGGLQRKLADSASRLKGIGNVSPDTSLEQIVESKAGREWRSLKPGTKFSPQEIGEIMSVASSHAVGANRGAVADMLSAGYTAAAASIGTWAQNIDVAATELAAEAKKFRKAIEKTEDRLFTVHKDQGGWELDGVNQEQLYAKARFIDRVLRPALHRDALEELEQQVCQSDRTNKQLGELVGKLLQTDLLGEPITGSRRSDYRRRLSDALDELKKSINIEEELLEQHFALSSVVRGLLDAYQDKIQGMPAGPDRVMLTKLFRQRFGLDLIEHDSGGGLYVPAYEDVLVSMGIDLAKTCDPFMMMRDDRWRAAGDRVTLTLPDDEEVFTKNLIERMKNPQALSVAQLDAAAFEPKVGSNPYMMVAINQQSAVTEGRLGDLHSSETFDNITSMDYWQGDPNVAFWLEAAESSTGRAMFEGRDGVYGLGFADPRLVREPRYYEKRWRPWAATTTADEKHANAQTDAMLYALLGHVGSEVDDETRSACKRATTVVADVSSKWIMPLVARTKRSFTFARYPLHEGPSGLATNKRCWDVDDTIGSVGKFEESFTVGENAKAWVEAMLVERSLFMDSQVKKLGDRYEAQLRGLHAYLEDLWVEAKRSGGNASAFQTVVERLQQRLEYQMRDSQE